MIWFHCNHCGVQPTEVEGGIEMFITSCTHTFCKTCVGNVIESKKCVQCNKHPVQSVKVEAGMNAQVRGMFGNVVGSLKVVERVFDFQTKQDDILDGLQMKNLSETKKEKSDLEEQNSELKKQVSNEDERLKNLLSDQEKLTEELRQLEEDVQPCDDASQPGSPQSVGEEAAVLPPSTELNSSAASPSGSTNNMSVISYNTTVGNIFQAIKTPDCLKLKKTQEPRTEVHEDVRPSLVVELPDIRKSLRPDDQVHRPPGHRLNINSQCQQNSKTAALSKQLPADRSAAPQPPTALSPITRPTAAPVLTKLSAAPAAQPGPVQTKNPSVPPMPFAAPPAKPAHDPIQKRAPVFKTLPPMTSTPISLDLPSNPKSTMPRPQFLPNKFPFLP